MQWPIFLIVVLPSCHFMSFGIFFDCYLSREIKLKLTKFVHALEL